MAFSASESAFEGFRIIRREPATVAVWAVLLLLFSVGGVALMAPMMRSLTATALTPGATPTASQLASIGSFGRFSAIILPVELIVFSVFSAAVYRAVLRPQDKAFARLRLGGDELRLLGLFIVLAILMFIVFMAVALVAALIAAGVIAASGSTGNSGLLLMVLVIYGAMIAVWAWLGVKFSFAAPMTFAERRFRVFESWKATKGKFWPLLGCYLLAFVFIILIALVDVVISGALLFGMSGGSLSGLTAMFKPDGAFMNLTSPVYIARLLIGSVFGVVLWVVGLAPAATAYREIAGPRPQDQADAFT